MTRPVGLAGERQPPETSVRLLQAVVAVLAFIPLSAGAAGTILGPRFVGVDSPWPTDLDSHFRFLSGVFFAIGIGFLSTVPRIAMKTARFRLLSALVFIGGLARLASLGLAGMPSTGHVAGLAMELVVVPFLVVWQGRVSERQT